MRQHSLDPACCIQVFCIFSPDRQPSVLRAFQSTVAAEKVPGPLKLCASEKLNTA